MKTCYWFSAIAICALMTAPAPAEDRLGFHVGTATAGPDAGIFYGSIDLQSGSVGPLTRATAADRTSFLWRHPSLDVLYSVAEITAADGSKQPSLASWSIGDDGKKLSLLNHQPSHGGGPCYVTVRSDGAFAAVANYSGGSIAIYPLDDQGRLQPASDTVQHSGSGPDPQRQQRAHAHSAMFSPSGNQLLAADLGTDDLFVYDVSPAGKLTPAAVPSLKNPPGSGPRHFAFSPDGRFVLSLGELSGTISVFAGDLSDGQPLQTVSTVADDLPADANRWCAEILFHPTLPVVYCSNRGPQEIAVFDFDVDTGQLTRRGAVPCGGLVPRNFRLTPDGRFLIVANQDSDNLAVFRVAGEDGALALLNDSISVTKPMCIKFATDR